MTPTHITNFFSIANTKIKLVEEVRKHFGKETSPKFNSFDFWWIDENKVSEILAFFLNPHENHEQGDIYLKHFIKKFNFTHFTCKEGDNIYVQCEFSTNEKRRIDIVIFNHSQNWAIGIENKINTLTVDQPKQLEHYNTYLSERAKDYCLIYLAPKDKEIWEESMSSVIRKELQLANNFKHLTYEDDLVDCVSEFAMMTESIRVRSFLKDFEKTLRRRYMGEKDMEAKEAIIEMMKESDKNLETSCLIYNSWLDMQQQLKDEFKSQLLGLKNELDLDVVDYNDNKVWLRPRGWTKHYFGYSFEAGHVFYGITQSTLETNEEKFTEAINYLNDELNGGYQYAGWWPIYKYLSTNIVSNTDFWIAIRNGAAKEEMRNFIKVMMNKYQTDDFELCVK